MLQEIMNKMQTLSKELEESAARHNSMIGAMSVLKELYTAAVEVAPVVEAMDPAVKPAVDAVEAIVDAL